WPELAYLPDEIFPGHPGHEIINEHKVDPFFFGDRQCFLPAGRCQYRMPLPFQEFPGGLQVFPAVINQQDSPPCLGLLHISLPQTFSPFSTRQRYAPRNPLFCNREGKSPARAHYSQRGQSISATCTSSPPFLFET